MGGQQELVAGLVAAVSPSLSGPATREDFLAASVSPPLLCNGGTDPRFNCESLQPSVDGGKGDCKVADETLGVTGAGAAAAAGAAAVVRLAEDEEDCILIRTIATHSGQVTNTLTHPAIAAINKLVVMLIWYCRRPPKPPPPPAATPAATLPLPARVPGRRKRRPFETTRFSA